MNTSISKVPEVENSSWNVNLGGHGDGLPLVLGFCCSKLSQPGLDHVCNLVEVTRSLYGWGYAPSEWEMKLDVE